ncbi:MAG: 3-phosphoshikimate 1-carboxyvinyltransferase [Thermoleophilia bacterium]
MPESGSFGPARSGLRGAIAAPGDKSISHRALMFGAVSRGPVRVRGFLRSDDTLASVAAMRAFGVEVEEISPTELTVHGAGWEGLSEPADVINVGNAGTLMRLLPGLVAGRPFLTVLTGDASIRTRPMARVLAPLAEMGARVWGRGGGTVPPVGIVGGALRGISHRLLVASAQVKSCVLLAGLQAEGDTVVVEPAPSRDHTERLIAAAGGWVGREDLPGGGVAVTVRRLPEPRLERIDVPGDPSSAAFPLVAALLVPDSRVTVRAVGFNPTRTGLFTVLHRMNARLTLTEGPSVGGEPRGDVTAETSELVATDVEASEVPLLIDELPIWALAAARAEGTSRLRGAAELRVKESDRLAAVAAVLRALGIEVTEYPEGLDIVGSPGGWHGGRVATNGDHRLAMVGAVAGLAATSEVLVDDIGCMAVSYPAFVATMETLLSPGGAG